MRHTAEVFLWGSRIGIVTQDDNEPAASFEYDHRFRPSGIQVSPLHMPLSERVYRFPALSAQSFRGLPGLLSDSLPDKFGNAVIDEWLARHGRSSDSFMPVERLCYTGARGMGALEYQPSEGPDASVAEAVNVSYLVELASAVLSGRQDVRLAADDAGLQSLLKFGTSAGGARAKAIVAWNPDTNEIRSGQVDAEPGFGFWILKFAGVSGNGDKEGDDPDDYACVEYAYHLMALQAGITMKECRLLDEGPRRHFMTRRFDREENTGRKIHMQTLAALEHWDYCEPGAHSYEQAAQTCLRLGLPQSQIDELFRRMVFNVLSMNCDDHVKNIAFLMDRKGIWALAPAYDMTFAFNPNGAWTNSHQMSVNGKRKDIVRADLLEAARTMNIGKARASTMIDKVSQAVAQWPRIAARVSISEQRISQIQATFPSM